MLKHNVIVIAFNAKLADGCDYATQTMQILGRTNDVYGLLLGEPVTWKDILSRHAARVVHQAYGSTLVRPLFVVPGQRFAVIRQFNYFLNALVLRVWLAFRHPGYKKVLWFFEPWNMVSIFWAFWGYCSLYDCVDYYHDLGAEWQQGEDFLIPKVNHMVYHSHTLASVYRKQRPDVRVVPLGFAADVFSRCRRTKEQRKTVVVGYIGGINYRLDFQLLMQIIQKLPDITFIFVGPLQLNLIPQEQDTREKIRILFSHPNVRYIGEIAKKSIGTEIASFDVGIIPYDLTFRFNRYSFPMKVMEYLWFGLPVIATGIEELKRFPLYVRIADTPNAWITALRSFMSRKQVARRAGGRTLAASHSWERKIEAISQILAAPPPRSQPQLL